MIIWPPDARRRRKAIPSVTREQAAQRRLAALRIAFVLGIAWVPLNMRAAAAQGFLAVGVKRMTILGIQQAISSLPPTVSQSFSYEYDPVLQSFIAGERLGSIALRSADAVGRDKWNLRAAVSFFQLERSFAPINYVGVLKESGLALSVEAGGKAKATAALVNLSIGYGIGDRWDLSLNLPMSIVSAHGSVNAFSRIDYPSAGGFSSDDTINDDDSVGIGRIGVAAQYRALSWRRVRVAVSAEFLNPSPSEAEYAGSESAALLPRLIGEVRLRDDVRLLSDVGYEYDFDEAVLRRLVWNSGISAAMARWITVDLGIGGSEYEKPLNFFPRDTVVVFPRGSFGIELLDSISVPLHTDAKTSIGGSLVDFLGGFKVRICDRATLGGTIAVPLNNQGFRASAIGTVAVEMYY